MHDVQAPSRSDRLTTVEAQQLDPSSLVGSFFHGTADHGWQGCVVGEPSPGTYLVELFDWVVGASSCQRLVPLAAMADWQFYDTAQWMNEAYHHGGVRSRWDKERAAS